MSVLSDKFVYIRECAKDPLNFVNLRKIFHYSAEICFATSAGTTEFGELLKCLTYDPETPANNTMWVNLEGSEDPAANNQVPAVVVRISDWQIVGLGLDSKTAHDDVAVESSGVSENSTFLASMTVNFEGQAKSGDTAVALAHVIFAFITGTRHSYASFSNVHEFKPVGISAPKKVKDVDGLWSSTATFKLVIEYTVTTRQESHLLKKVIADAAASLE